MGFILNLKEVVNLTCSFIFMFPAKKILLIIPKKISNVNKRLIKKRGKYGC